MKKSENKTWMKLKNKRHFQKFQKIENEPINCQKDNFSKNSISHIRRPQMEKSLNKPCMKFKIM